MSRNNFFSLPTDDQVSSLERSKTQNASQALGLQAAPSGAATSQPAPPNNPPPTQLPADMSQMDPQAMQQMMSMLQTMMSQSPTQSQIPQKQAQGQSAPPQQPKVHPQQTPKPQPVSTPAPIKPQLPSSSTASLTYQYPSPMSDQIYLGGASDARNKTKLKSNEIQFILNLCPRSLPQFFPSDFIYKDFDISDNPLKVMEFWSEMKQYMDNCINSGMKILIHDETGEWKSSAIVIAYFCTTFHWTLKESYDFCKSRRREVKFPPQCLVALGNWEISTMGSSTLTEIVLSKKQKNKSKGVGGGQIIEDKSLQGFLSSRQARIFFDDYEHQITQLTIQHRNIWAQYSQLRVYTAQLEHQRELDAVPTVPFDMQDYCALAEISPYLTYFQQYDAMLQEYNAILGGLLSEFESTSNPTALSDSSLQPLPDTMKDQYASITKYIQQNASGLMQQGSQYGLPVISDSTPVTPKYRSICALTDAGRLTITQHTQPTTPINRPAQNSEQSQQPSTSSTICLFCSSISAQSTCQCGENRQDLLTALHKTLKAHQISDIQGKEMSIFTTFILSQLCPDLFSPSTFSLPSINHPTQQQDDKPTSAKISTLIAQIGNLKKQLDSQISQTLPPPASSPQILGLADKSTPGRLDPQMSTASTQSVKGLSAMLATLKAILKSIQLHTTSSEIQSKHAIIQTRMEYIANIYTTITQIDTISTFQQQQLFAQYLSLVSSTSSDSQAMFKLQTEIDTAAAQLEEEKTAKEALQKGHAAAIDALEKDKTAKIEEKNAEIDKMAKELEVLRTQTGDVDVTIAQLTLASTTEKERAVELETVCQKLQQEVELDGEKIESLERAEKALTAENALLLAKIQALEGDLKEQKKNRQSESETLAQLNAAKAAKLLEISNDDDRLQYEAIKLVIGILQTQKIWLGMQLGLTKSATVRKVYAASLTSQQLQLGLNGQVPDAFIYVLEVTPDSVAAKCGLKPQDVVVSFNGTLISSVKQIHSIATDITPGERITIAILRPESGELYNPMILSMETRSRLLSNNQLAMLRSIHKGELRCTPDVLQQVMTLKELCDQDANGGNVGPALLERHGSPRTALLISPDVVTASSATGIAGAPLASPRAGGTRRTSLQNLTLGRTFSLQSAADQVAAMNAAPAAAAQQSPPPNLEKR